MSSDHQDTSGFPPPITVEELHRQPPSSTTRDNTLRLPNPHTSSPMASAIETNDPESPIAASPGGEIFITPSTSFDAAAATTTTTTVNTRNPFHLTLTDTNSSPNQHPPTTTTTPPNVSEPPRRNTILRRSHFDPIETDSQEPQKNKTPPRRVSSPPKSRTSPPRSSTHKQIPQSKLRKMGDKVSEIKQRFWNVIRQSNQEHAKNDNPPQEMVERRDRDGCFKFKLSCSCGKREGICTDVAFFLNIILILFFFFVIGISYSFLLVLSILFR